MKYVVHIKPSEECSRRIAAYKERITHALASPKPVHCTLMTLWSQQDEEERIVNTLRNIRQLPFVVTAERFDIFDESSLVVRLQKSPELMQLHNSIINGLSTFINWAEVPPPLPQYIGDTEREAVRTRYGTPYYERFYNPHITVARLKDGLQETPRLELLSCSWRLEEFFLIRKEDRWIPINTFPLSGT